MALYNPTMQTLGGGLKPSVKKKPGMKTQGKVVPVMKGAKPYKPPSRRSQLPATPTPQNANQLGVNAQQKAMESKPAASTAFNVNYEADPVLARIKALGTQDVANARTEADSLRKKAILDSGLGDIGTEIGLDAGTVQAANENPFSTNAMIDRQGIERGRDIDESLNQQNLFYSGHRANQIQDLGRNQLQARTGLQGDIRELLGGINQGVTGVEQQAAMAEQQATMQAAEAQREAALQQAYLDSLLPPAVEPGIQDVLGLGGESFITPETAAAAQVSPYNYDPYEEELQRLLGVNSTAMAPMEYF